MFRFVVSLFLALFLMTSCDFFKKESKPIDFTTLDQYPLFDNCDSLAVEEVRKACFEETIVQFIQKDLDTCQFISQSYLRNTGLIIHINVNKEGKCSVQEIEKINSVEEALPELQMQIISTIENLPYITPAKKQGQNVSSRFMIPLYIEKE
jgi:hypothetical protein